MKEEIKTVYIAEDGAEFSDKNECFLYENYIKNFKYFIVDYCRDLTETGNFQLKNFICCQLFPSIPLQVVEKFIADEYCQGQFIDKGVQGYGILTTFEYKEVDKETFLKQYMLFYKSKVDLLYNNVGNQHFFKFKENLVKELRNQNKYFDDTCDFNYQEAWKVKL